MKQNVCIIAALLELFSMDNKDLYAVEKQMSAHMDEAFRELLDDNKLTGEGILSVDITHDANPVVQLVRKHVAETEELAPKLEFCLTAKKFRDKDHTVVCTIILKVDGDKPYEDFRNSMAAKFTDIATDTNCMLVGEIDTFTTDDPDASDLVAYVRDSVNGKHKAGAFVHPRRDTH